MGTLDKAEVMKVRTRQFAIRIVAVVRSLPRTREGDVIGKQLLRCGTAVAANYRAVCRSRSQAEFISKMNVVVEEADETVFWPEFIADTKILPAENSVFLSKKGTSCWRSARLLFERQNITKEREDWGTELNHSMTQSFND